jgi:hypothetical protein
MQNFTFFADKDSELPPSSETYRLKIPMNMASYVVFPATSSEMECKN